MRNKFSVTILALLAFLCASSLFTIKTQAISFDPASSSTVVMDANSGQIFYSHNMNTKLPLASTTKIITAITVIENADVNKIIEVNPKAVGIEGSSMYLQKGDRFTILDLLYGLMLRSGNDSAAALALEVGGSIEGFSALMNQTAQKAGAKSSNFVNPSGLHNDNHYVTGYDLAKVTSYALNNPTFAKVVNAKNATVTNHATNQKTVLANKNKLLFNYKGSTGVKTGYTKNAGRCFVGAAKRDGLQLVFVTLNCGPMFEKCAEAFDKVFEQYKRIEILKSGETIATVKDKTNQQYNVVCGEGLSFVIEKSKQKEIQTEINLTNTEQMKLENNKNIGEIKIFYDKQLIFSQKLYTIRV